MTPREIAVLLLSVSAVFFAIVAAVGLIRLPDIYSRTHAASKSETLGAILALGAVAASYGFDYNALKVVLLLLFMFLTNPTAAHAIARAARERGIEPWTTEDEP
jgi:multicomponent Na+:H+ antiporter subunit G